MGANLAACAQIRIPCELSRPPFLQSWLRNHDAEHSIAYPVTPDGRYFVVRGRLWRCANPGLPEEPRQSLVRELMAARRAVGAAQRAADLPALAQARAAVDAAKVALGERGPVWWKDGAPDYNRHMARNTPYADWYARLDQADDDAGSGS